MMTHDDYAAKCKLFMVLLAKYTEMPENIDAEDEALLEILSKNEHLRNWAAGNFKPNKYLQP